VKLPRWFIGPAKDLKRPSFPEKLVQPRGDVNAVKPVIRVKRKPIDYRDLGVIE